SPPCLPGPPRKRSGKMKVISIPRSRRPMNFRRFIIPAAISAGLLAAASIGVTEAVAHHAFAAEFDGKSPVLLRGKVTKVEWINPHAWVHVNVVAADGKETVWMEEGGTPTTLLHAVL